MRSARYVCKPLLQVYQQPNNARSRMFTAASSRALTSVRLRMLLAILVIATAQRTLVVFVKRPLRRKAFIYLSMLNGCTQ